MSKNSMASKFLKVTAATSIALTSLSGVPFNVLANEVPAVSQMATGVSVDVSTWAEFKAALESSTVTDVKLTANILMGSDASINGSSKTIQGNGHTIDANSKRMLITANGNAVKISNAVITRTSSDGIVYSTNSGSLQANVTLDNVTSSGSRLFILGNANLFLENNITDTSTFNYSLSAGSISADTVTLQNNANVSLNAKGVETFALKVGTNMNVSSDSKLVLNGAGSAMQLLAGGVLNVDGTMELSGSKYDGLRLENASRVRVNKGGKLIGNRAPRSIILGIKSNTIENAGEILINTNNAAIQFEGADSHFINSGIFDATTTASGNAAFVSIPTAKLQLKSGSHFTMKSINTFGWASLYVQDIEVEDGATLDMDVKTTASALVSKESINLKSGSNISISNSAGRALGGTPTAKVQLDSDTGISTWTIGNVSSLEPTRSYAGPLNLYVELTGYVNTQTQKNIQSNNIDATLFYINKDIGKIASGSFVKDTKQIEFENAAREAVNGLFTSKDPKNDIKTGLTQAEIDAAQALINKVTDPAKKAALQADLNKAQSQLDTKTAQAEAQNKAREAVNNLFTNKNPNGTITGTMTQADIDAAQALINKVTDPTKKAELQADLNKAQSQLDAKTAQAEAENKAREAVNNLFTNKDPNGNITNTMTQADIDAAQALINKVTDPTKKAALQTDLNKAQSQLDAKKAQADAENKAREAVNNLFTNKDPNGTITGTMTQADIDAAQALINKVTDPTKKAALQADLNKAQSQLDAKKAQADAENKAREAVNNLFTNKDPNGTITGAVTQAAIDAAQALVNKVTDPTKKAALQKDLDKAKAQFSTNGILKPDDFVLGTTSITGSYSGDVDRITLSKDGVEAGNATKTNGTFKFYVGPGVKKDQALYMVAYDKNGREIAREKVNIAAVTAGQITPAAMTIPGDSNISGTYTGDVSRIEVSITNEAGTTQVYKGGTVANGTFKFYSFDKTKSPKDIIVVRAYDSVGKLLDTKTVTIKNNVVTTAGQITPATMTIPGNTTMTGTVSGDVATLKVTVNGVVYAGGSITDGTFKFYTFDKIKKADDTVVVAAYDKAGKLLDSKSVTIQAPTK
ncbi:hypothetical protein HB848_05420 [Listeria rocourtiae]|uniref:toxin Cry1Ac domain D-VI-related protein n=1 Tax=Listeria rocourtiae TaxID=647910 RepID=UPI0016237AC8|nr:toxin Cry1Ac domain D-VI-related protein [Listeria rocourtiae]MBC1434776.1 hypothetical protein [Listeria rocourtiae]